MTGGEILRLEGIDKRFPGVHALDKVDLGLTEGEIHMLLGENGAGKSTLLKILSGSIQKDAGRILLRGRPVEIADAKHARALGIGMVYQELSLIPGLTAIQLKAYLPPELIWLGSGAVLGVPVPAVVAVAAALLGLIVLHYSRLGRSALAVGGNREAARVSGINVDRTKIAVYAFCGSPRASEAWC